jgi:predicted ABC-type ATPase
MEWRSLLEARPVVVALAGPNGAGKSTFFHSHLADTGLRFVNADDLAAEMGVGAYEGAELAASLRAGLVSQRESFVFETVLSDHVGAKVAELVEMRVMQGGHDVPDEKLEARFQRTLANLDRAIKALPVVIIFENTDLARPFQLEAVYEKGRRIVP